MSAFLLHINHVLDLKNSKLHKRHLSLFLNQTNSLPNQVLFIIISLYTPEKSKGPAIVHTTRPTHGKEKQKKQTFGFLWLMKLHLTWIKFPDRLEAFSLAVLYYKGSWKGCEGENLRWNRTNKNCFQRLGQKSQTLLVVCFSHCRCQKLKRE